MQASRLTILQCDLTVFTIKHCGTISPLWETNINIGIFHTSHSRQLSKARGLSNIALGV